MEIGSPRATRRPWGDADTIFAQIGGDEAVKRLSHAFYDTIEAESPKLRAMLPATTRVSREKLYEFLSGWMGGPPLYWERRGHPALQVRHAPFPIDADAATQWVACMRRAIEVCEFDEPAASWLGDELERVAKMLQNLPD